MPPYLGVPGRIDNEARFRNNTDINSVSPSCPQGGSSRTNPKSFGSFSSLEALRFLDDLFRRFVRIGFYQMDSIRSLIISTEIDGQPGVSILGKP